MVQLCDSFFFFSVQFINIFYSYLAFDQAVDQIRYTYMDVEGAFYFSNVFLICFDFLILEIKKLFLIKRYFKKHYALQS